MFLMKKNCLQLFCKEEKLLDYKRQTWWITLTNKLDKLKKEQEETKRQVQKTKEEEETKRQAQANSQASTQDGGEGLGQASRVGHRPTLPKLPAFRDKTDDIDSYLFRFETHATALKWDRTHWVTYLSALLEGTALTLFHSLSDTEDGTVTYEQLKSALLKKFQCTPEGFRKRFRESKPTAAHFIGNGFGLVGALGTGLPTNLLWT